MKTIPLLSLSFLLAGLAHSYDDYFFFGDSLTDTGNVAASLGGSLGPGYPGTSFTNGTTWAKYLDPNLTNIVSLNATSTPSAGSVDFSFGGATTGPLANPIPGVPNSNTHLISQASLFATSAAPLVEADSNDLAFVWAGGNDFLAANVTLPPAQLQASLLDIADQATTNITTAVSEISHTTPVENIAVVNLINIGLSPRLSPLPDAAENFGRIASVFNSQLNAKLQPLSQQANIMVIDANAFVSDVYLNPSRYGISNVTDPSAPNAGSGVPSPLTPAEQAERLFYDDIHPSTIVHRQFARYVAAHLVADQSAETANLLTDAALALDDRFGFETQDLTTGDVRFDVALSNSENQSGNLRRQTQGLRADLDFGVSDHMAVGAEVIYAQGEAGNAEFDSLAFAMDATHGGSINGMLWEIGLGGGAIQGDLDRNFGVGTLQTTGEQFATVFTLHAALQKTGVNLFGRNGYWEVGLKERLVYRDAALEKGGGSLALSYDSDTITTTVANFELGIELTDTLLLELALNPVLHSSGGNLSGSQVGGFGSFNNLDATGYDTHTARAGLRAILSQSTTLHADVIAGDDSTWGASFGLTIDL
ncbi:MAG: SGNH/GDSL hydrolase family protein [Verrucomicrobiaceae bacterium]